MCSLQPLYQNVFSCLNPLRLISNSGVKCTNFVKELFDLEAITLFSHGANVLHSSHRVREFILGPCEHNEHSALTFVLHFETGTAGEK